MSLTDVTASPNAPRAPRPAAEEADAPQIAAIDGLRAIAVLTVVVYHFSAALLPGGFLGVDLFFVISGFVITRMLIIERADHARTRLRRFWLRRARRLLPAVLVLVVVVQIWQHSQYASELAKIVNGQSWSSLLYASNWWSILRDVGYGDVASELSPLNHLWSLAIEEQFYLLWPLVFVAFRGRRLLLLVGGLVLTSAALQVLLGGASSGMDRTYLGTDTRVVALLVGCAIALWTVRREDGAEREPRTDLGWLLTAVVGPLCLVALLAATVVLHYRQEELFRGQLLAVTALEGLLVLCVVLSPDAPLARFLARRPFQYVGQRSYSLYLWHWPILVMVTPATSGDNEFITFLDRVFLIAMATLVSYNFIESPIRHSRLAGYRLALTVAIPCALIMAMVLTPLGPQPTATAEAGGNVVAAVNGGRIDLTKDPGRGAKVLTVGDSWAKRLGDAARDVSPRTTVINEGIPGCGLADPAIQDLGEGRTRFLPKHCLAWQENWRQAIRLQHPTAVVLEAGNVDQLRQHIGGKWMQACDRAFDVHYARQLDRALAILAEARVPIYVLTVTDWSYRDGTDTSVCMNRLLTEAADRHEAQVLDLTGFLCPEDACPQGSFDATGHLNVEPQEYLSRWVLGNIYAVANHLDASGVPVGDPGSGATVMVAGDSWGHRLGNAMPEVSSGTKVINTGLGGCGLANPTTQEVGGMGNVEPPSHCTNWRERWQAALDEDPSAIVLETGNYDQGRMLVEGEWMQVCDDDFEEYYAGILDEAFDMLEAEGVPIYVVKVTAASQRADVQTAPCMNKLLGKAAKAHDHTMLLDLQDLVCPEVCPADTFDQTGHLGQRAQRLTARWVLGQVYADARDTGVTDTSRRSGKVAP